MSIIKKKVLIFGGGWIGSQIDQKIDISIPKSHCGSFYKSNFFKIYCIIEPNISLHKKLRLWEPTHIVKKFSDYQKIKTKIDVVSIASSTKNHYLNLKQAISIKPKVILCEKPLTSNLKQTNEIYKLCKTEKIKLIINYNRRFDNSMVEIKKNIVAKKYGDVSSVSCHYNKGLLNNGSHLIDLLLYFFNNLKLSFSGKKLFDYDRNDASIPFVLYSKKIPIFVNINSSKDYYFFQIMINFTNYSLIINNGGNDIDIYKAFEDKKLNKIKILKFYKSMKTNYDISMINLVKHIKKIILKKNEFKYEPTTKSQSLKLYKLITDIRKQSK